MKNKRSDYEVKDLIKFMRLSPEKKLRFLEKLNRFLQKATPLKNKKIWEKLKEAGW